MSESEKYRFEALPFENNFTSEGFLAKNKPFAIFKENELLIKFDINFIQETLSLDYVLDIASLVLKGTDPFNFDLTYYPPNVREYVLDKSKEVNHQDFFIAYLPISDFDPETDQNNFLPFHCLTESFDVKTFYDELIEACKENNIDIPK